MRKLFFQKSFLFLSCFYPFSSYANQSLQVEIQNISPGWHVEQITSGSLHQKTSNDAAAILTKKNIPKKHVDDPDEIAALRIYFRNNNGQLILKKEDLKSICLDCGGAAGGHVPFQIQIKKGVLWLTHFGGSREKFSNTSKWRFQNKDFYLVGINETVEDNYAIQPNAIRFLKRDVNVLNLNMNEKVELIGHHKGKSKSVHKLFSCHVPNIYQNVVLGQNDNIKTPTCSNYQI